MHNHLEELISLFSKLPSLGPRSSKRIVLHLIKNKSNLTIPLIDSLQSVMKSITHCKICANIDVSDICSICNDKKRNDKVICVVEDIADLWALERGNFFNGKYHILGGVLSAISGQGPESLNIDSLINRIKNNEISELIIATNPTVDGQTTAYYIAEIMKEFNVKISKLAHGIPIGGEIDYLDEGTLDIAFKTRSNF